MIMALDSERRHRQESASRLFQLGRACVKEGHKEEGRRYLERAVEQDREHSDAWLWLSATTDDPLEQKKYLEWAIAANPGSPEARRGLAILEGRLNPKDVLPQGAGVEPQNPVQPAEAVARRTFVCPQCGGALRFDPEIVDLKCANCGFVEVVEEAAMADVQQVMDVTLPTRKGHRWAEAEREMTCEQCGATTIFPVGQTSAECPFCGSAALVSATDDSELLTPNGVILMGFEADEARRILGNWLGGGFFTPDDLTKLARGKGLHAAYVPFWIFEGTLTGRWQAEVLEGSGRERRWVQRNGEHTFFYSNRLQVAATALPADLVKKAEPFALEKMVEYKPEYLAGWPAAAYNISLADASLEARAAMVADAKKQLVYKAAPGQAVRNLEVSASEFSGVAYKLALLPLWVGAYTYRGKSYRVLINGQTKEVAGDKPKDSVKVAMVVAGVLIALAILAIGVFYLMGRG